MNLNKTNLCHCICGSFMLAIALTGGNLSAQNTQTPLPMQHHQIERQCVTLSD